MTWKYEIIVSIQKRNIFHFKTKVPISPARTVFSSTVYIKFHGPKIWELTPGEMKELETLANYPNNTFIGLVRIIINNIFSTDKIFFVDLLKYGIRRGAARC